jgi:GTPase SAR1 family protein
LIWDIGASLIPLWKYYITYTQGLIFVVDSSDKEGIIKAKHEFQNILANEDVRKSVILILANKSDIAQMKIEDITQIL